MPNDILTNLAEERAAESDATLPSAASRIRWAFFHGEHLTREIMRDRFGVSKGMLDMTMRDMGRLGYNFDSSTSEETAESGWPVTEFWLRNPRFVPGEADVEKMRVMRGQRKSSTEAARKQKDAERKRRERAERSAANGNGDGETPRRGPVPKRPPLPVLPGIGQELRVVMLAVDEATGLVRIGLRNGTVAWECSVEAQTLIST